MSMHTKLEESLARAREAERDARRQLVRAEQHVVHCEGVVNELAAQLRAEQLTLAEPISLRSCAFTHNNDDCEICSS